MNTQFKPEDLIDHAKVARYLNALGLSWTLGECIGIGGFACVYDLPGTPDVLKVVDTRCFSSADDDSLMNVRLRKKVYEYTMREISGMKRVGACHSQYVVCMKDWYELILDPQEQGLAFECRRLFRSVFLVRMQRVTPLLTYLKQGHTVQETVVPMLCDCLKGLAALHGMNILHRDVKPENISVSQDGHFVVMDLGICRQMDSFGKVTNIGTMWYKAPEIEKNQSLRGRMNSDLYSLAKTALAILGVDDEQGDIGEQLPAELRPILEKALREDPAVRYQTAQEMLWDLEQLVSPSQPQNFVMDAKIALLADDFSHAWEFALQGAERHDPNSERMLGYLLYLKWRREGRESERLIQDASRVLESLAIQGDKKAKALCGMILLDKGNPRRALPLLQQAADDHCVMAQYLYGRILHRGDYDGVAQPEKGLQYILQAAEAGYLPAIRIAAHLLKQQPHPERFQDMVQMMEGELLNYSQERADNILRFV